MTTYTTSAPISMQTNATFQAWVSEVISSLVTHCGMTQTSDTGQINTSTVALPTVSNTSAGYVILAFNDALQTATPTAPNATASVYIKLEFGTGNSTSNPQMWITLGTGPTNNNGILTGVVSSRQQVMTDTTIPSQTQSLTSYYMYNSTLGIAGMVFKLNAFGTTNYANISAGGFYIFRSNDSSGNPTGDCINMIVGNTNFTSYSPSMSCNSFISNLAYGGSEWSMLPLSAAGVQGYSSTYNGTTQVFPVFYQSPYYSISSFCAVGPIFDFPVGGTFTMTLIGSTSHTWLSAGMMFGTDRAAGTGSDAGNTNSFLMIWE